MEIPSNITPEKKPTASDAMGEICKLIIKRLDRIEKRNQKILALLDKKKQNL